MLQRTISGSLCVGALLAAASVSFVPEQRGSPRVVVVGAGAAGLGAVTALAEAGITDLVKMHLSVISKNKV